MNGEAFDSCFPIGGGDYFEGCGNKIKNYKING